MFIVFSYLFISEDLSLSHLFHYIKFPSSVQMMARSLRCIAQQKPLAPHCRKKAYGYNVQTCTENLLMFLTCLLLLIVQLE